MLQSSEQLNHIKMDRRPSIKTLFIISAAAERDKFVKGMKVTEMYIRAAFSDIKTSDSKKLPDLIFIKWEENEWEKIRKHPC